MITQSIISIMMIATLGLISPGPDFVMVLKNSLSHSRKYGIYTALGITLGTLFHISYISLGLEFVVKQNIGVFVSLQYFGASYLIYMGYKSFTKESNLIGVSYASTKISAIRAISSGFLTDILNPQVVLFFIGLFTIAIDKNTHSNTIMLYTAMIVIETFAWYSFVALIFSNNQLKSHLKKFQYWVDKIIGVILIAFGVGLICD